MPAPEFVNQDTVQRFAASLDGLSAGEVDERLELLEAFVEFVGDSPDEMIRTVFDEESHTYKRRGRYTNAAKEFAATFGDAPNAQLQRSNIIRAFFIANGRRLLPERPQWMTDDG